MTIERSTELLRQALPWMSRQSAALHPVSYAVWFDYVDGTNPPLNAAVDEHLAREGRLDEFAVHALFKRHVADVDPESAQRVVDGLQRVLGNLGEVTSATGAHLGRFGTTLGQLAVALERGDTGQSMSRPPTVAHNGPPPRHLADVVAEVIADTGAMRTRMSALQQRVAEGRREIDRLRDEVRRARDEALRDSLTGLGNRRAFDQSLAACLMARAGGASPTAAASAHAAIEAAMAPPGSRRADRQVEAELPPTPAPPVAPAAPPVAGKGPWLLLSDVDHYDHIDATYGRGFAEEVLKAVADILRGVVPHGATLARVEGPVFAILLPELDAAEVHEIAERARTQVGAARIRQPGREESDRLTLSLGLAAHREGDTPAALLERAGQALRQARQDGRDRIATLE